MSERHSPGPWRVTDNNGSADIFDAGQCLVATVHPENEDLGADSYLATDARLIAAAPEMLAMLRDLQGVIDDEGWAPCDEAALGQLLSRIDGEDA